MDAHGWRQVKDIVARAIELEPAERLVFLDAAPIDAAQRRLVHSFVAAYGSDPEFLETDPLVELSPVTATGSPKVLAPGQILDDYRIVRQIGEGGMGDVYEAEQLAPIRRTVALKLLRHGSRDRHALERFRAEGQILASLSHPSIARIFAAGDLEGQPYLAMERVEGLPITDYGDRHRLTVEQRLHLMIKVCRGVQHAHQRGVIHRDLKPSNILVTEQDGAPFPKVIDFGISKTTKSSEDAFTEEGLWLGTPDYMSPEQATGRGALLDTRSDVYSLGIVLYELLTGCLPFDTRRLRRQGLDVLLRELREAEPKRPSRRYLYVGDALEDSAARASARGLTPRGLSGRLRGDLDQILLKALEKNPENRYASPHELARDLLRHLDHLPLLATEPGTLLVVKKLIRRHRLGFVAATAVAISLLVGMVGTGVGLLRARQAERQASQRAEQARWEAERANREAATANRVTDFMWEVFRASDPADPLNAPGSTLRDVLDQGAERVRSELDDEPRVQARLMSAIGRSYASLGRLSEGLALLEQSVDLYEHEAPGSEELAESLHLLSGTQLQLAQYASSLRSLERSLAIRRRLYGEAHYLNSWVLHDMGRVLAAQGKTAEAIPLFEKALVLKRQIYGEKHPSVARTLNSIGLRFIEIDQPEKGKPLVERSLRILEEHYGPDHPEVAPALDSLAMAHRALGDLETAEHQQWRVLSIDERTFGEDHPHVATSLVTLAQLAWDRRRDCDESLKRVRRAQGIFERHFPEGHPDRISTARQLADLEGYCPQS